MNTRETRLKAIRETAASSGKPAVDVLGALAQTWGINAFEAAWLAAQLRSTPAVHSADASAARASVEQSRAERTRQADADALDAWTTYARANAFERVQIRQRVGSATLERGRQLDALATEDPEPPRAA